jgi:hypothetical protein
VLNNRIRTALVVLAASAGLGACTNFGPYGGVGVGVGSGYGSYGSPYGYGYGYGDPYYGSYYNRYPTYGWYDGFYYPGRGYWVYDPGGQAHPINEKQKSYWANILAKVREARGATATAETRENWSGFSTQGKVAAPISVESTAQADKPSRRQIVQARRQERLERQQSVVESQPARSESRSSIRQQIIERRAARRAAETSGD